MADNGAMAGADATPSGIEATLLDLNYRWSSGALTLWRGVGVTTDLYHIYDGLEDLFRPATLDRIDAEPDPVRRQRLRHAFIDHYLQNVLMPHEAEMRTWMRGAAALVGDRRVYFREIIPWCQKESTLETRKVIQDETGPLCKFLTPFAINYWEVILEELAETFGFRDYIDYCGRKKGIDYPSWVEPVRELLAATDDLYFPAMDRWCRDRYDRSLSSLTRFDAIHLLSLESLDGLLPDRPLESTLGFLDTWEIDPEAMANLHLELSSDCRKSAQGMSFLVHVPDEIYVLMRPEGGWIDLETLWHELGHGLSAAFTDPSLPEVDRNLATTFSLSEAFAFLLQRVALSRPFLTDVMGLSASAVDRLRYYQTLRDLSAFRRYAAKFISEYEMFASGQLADGVPYARRMARHTGFYHQPESHLFDLVPELYSLDYILGWIAEAGLEAHLVERFGEDWMTRPEAGKVLRGWWAGGGGQAIETFFDRNGLPPLSPEPLLARWRAILGATP